MTKAQKTAENLSNPELDPVSHANEAAAEWVDLDSLTAWDKNPRKNDDAAKDVAKSIKRFGFAAPIVARKANREIIAGHTRAKAAQILGLKKVPVRFVDLDPAEAHLLALADNKLNEKAEWDDKLLGEVLSEFSLDDAALAGWDSKELDKMAGIFGATELSPEDAFGALPVGDKEPFQQMTFTLHDSQVELVKRAIDSAKLGDFSDSPNQNSNGNALSFICEKFLGDS